MRRLCEWLEVGGPRKGEVLRTPVQNIQEVLITYFTDHCGEDLFQHGHMV